MTPRTHLCAGQEHVPSAPVPPRFHVAPLLFPAPRSQAVASPPGSLPSHQPVPPVLGCFSASQSLCCKSHCTFLCPLDSLTAAMAEGEDLTLGRSEQGILMQDPHPPDSCPGKRILLLNSLLGVFVSTPHLLL